ncbi:hypothetical protein JZ751_012474 [Albula glossodonta]|uniref:Uncharacterized protein n=1 Tax=Albula glossodonta TaxID=121402 RepID=A0A8T2P308_9TELE|nr:hypothetical protein JZ751_012474 [Albula glossodonta]
MFPSLPASPTAVPLSLSLSSHQHGVTTTFTSPDQPPRLLTMLITATNQYVTTILAFFEEDPVSDHPHPHPHPLGPKKSSTSQRTVGSGPQLTSGLPRNAAEDKSCTAPAMNVLRVPPLASRRS